MSKLLLQLGVFIIAVLCVVRAIEVSAPYIAIAIVLYVVYKLCPEDDDPPK